MNPANRSTKHAAFAMISLLILAPVLMLAGCQGSPKATAQAVVERAQSYSADAGAIAADVRTQLGALDTQITAAQAAGADVSALAQTRDRLASVLDTARAEKAKWDAVAADYQARLAELPDDADPLAVIGAGAQAIGVAVPPPWGIYVTLAGGLLGGVGSSIWQTVKRRRTEAAAADVVRSIEAEKAKGSGNVHFADDAVKASLRSRMSDDARALVERARKTRAADGGA